MASDEIVWHIINHQFCAYKLKYVLLGGNFSCCDPILLTDSHRTTKEKNFCHNEYSTCS
jgi:hypothetical protein